MFLPSPPQKVRTSVNRDIKNYPPLSTQIEKVSDDLLCYYNQLFTMVAGGTILKLNNNNFNHQFLTIKLTKPLCTSRSSHWASIVKHPN